MLKSITLFTLIICFSSIVLCDKESSDDENELEGSLVTSLRNDVNLDLTEDEEYEDLRAELLAYHTALASLTSNYKTRRSMLSTPCWSLGGICVNYKLCTGFKSLSEVPGCKSKLKVCCFVWNRYNVRDLKQHGIGILAMPWSHQQPDFSGQGVIDVNTKPKKIKKKNLKLNNNRTRLSHLWNYY